MLGAIAAAVAEATGESALWALVVLFAIAQALVALDLLKRERDRAASPGDPSVWVLPAAFGVLAGGLLIWSLTALTSTLGTTQVAGEQQSAPTAGVPDEGALLSAGAAFSATAPWHLEVQGIENQRCNFSLLGVEGTTYQRFVDGATTMVHVRQTGTFEVHLPHHCSIQYGSGLGSVVQLPIQIDPTSQSGASPIFESANGFTVTMSADQGCNAVAFDATTGDDVTAVGAGSSAAVEGQGRFWLETVSRRWG